ncbi:MAG: A/G-specific adenine glycosylase [Bacteroidota bacterium]|jgi:A/G-specific adenine glycosylase
MKKTDFAKKLLAWFDTHGRKHLPWQINPTPYRVWVSEIMLQQTQVATVISYYLRFMDAFPTVADLAAASVDDVLGFWSGLGYYARGRHLHKAAQIIMDKHNGNFPLDFDAVVALPGIGRSTAGAILAFSTEQRHAILDGNVKRILCRHEAFEAPPNTAQAHDALWAIADKYTPNERISEYTQAVMDLGATLCTRTKPRCTDCPIQTSCQAKKFNRVSELPTKIKKAPKPTKARLFLIIQTEKGIALYQRPSKGIWGGLWSLPEWPDARKNHKEIQDYCASLQTVRETNKPIYLEALPPVQHQFTHYQLILKPMIFQTKSLKKNILFEDKPIFWCTPNHLHTLGLPAPIKKLLQQQFVTGRIAWKKLSIA